MATQNTITVGVNVTDNGTTGKRIADAKQLKKAYDDAATSAAKIGGTAGSRKFAAAGYSPSSGATMSEQTYGNLRGAAGATGASARDFANQAQGLGGVVRLYATWAANIFALSAAFNALREAANTDIMVRSMDKMSASSGIAMGGLAKDFANASGGAISLRQAMEATSKAISSGLTTKQFMDLGEAAKGASQALGVSMDDAVSRLTRGITKLEPELLDELGLFTKVGKSSEDYAKKVGKTVTSLTDFEKRQAFANAVLAEAKEKFGGLAAEANPYDKLLANLRNVAQEILSTINTVVAPIAKIFADNTALITAAIGLIALKITRQAIPAVTMWRQSLASAASDAAAKAREINTSFGEAFVERAQQRARVPQIRAAIESATAEFEAAKAALKESGGGFARPAQSTLMKAVAQDRLLTEKELVAATRQVNTLTKANTEDSLKHAASIVQVQAAQQKILDLKKEEIRANDIVQEQADKKSRFLGEDWRRERIVEDARAKEAKLTALGQVGGLVERKGLRGGLSEFYSDINANKDLSKFDKLKTKGVGTLIALGTEAQIFAKSLSKAFAYLELGIAIYEVLNLLFSKNSKEVDAFKSSISGLTEATKTATDVAEKYKGAISLESLNARANAFIGISDSIDKTAQSLIAADKAATWIDRFTDDVKVLWGGNLRSIFTKNMSEGVVSAIKNIPEGDLRSELEDKLKVATGALKLDAESLAEAFGKLNNEKLKTAGAEIGVILKNAQTFVMESQALTKDIQENAKATETAYLALANSVKDTSVRSTFLSAALKEAISLEKAFKNIDATRAALKSITDGSLKLDFLDPKLARELMPKVEAFSELSTQADKYSKSLNESKTRVSEINDLLKNGEKSWYKFGITTETSTRLTREREQLRNYIKEVEQGAAKTSEAMLDAAKAIQGLLKQNIGQQIDLILQESVQKIQQLSIKSKQAAASKFPTTTEESIKYQSKLALDAIAIEENLFKTNQTLVRSLDLLTIQVQRDADLRELDQLSKMSIDDITTRRADELRLRVAQSDIGIKAYTTGNTAELARIAKDNPAFASLVQSSAAMAAAAKQFSVQRQEVQLDTGIKLINQRYETMDKAFETEITRLRTQIEAIQGSTADTDRQRAELETQIRALELAKTVTAPSRRDAEIAALVGPAAGSVAVTKSVQAKIASEAATKTETFTTAESVRQTNTALDIQVKTIKEAAQADKDRTASLNQRLQLEEQATLDNISYAKEVLDLNKSLGNISEDYYTKESALLKLREAEIQRTRALREAENEYRASTFAYQEDFAAQGYKDSQVFKERRALIESTYNAAITGANNAYIQQSRLSDLQLSLNERIKGYGEIFQKTFEGMNDAILEFVKTGKLNFKSLVSSMIEDIIRLELRMATTKLWQGMKPGFDSFLGSLFGSGSPGPGSTSVGAVAGNIYANYTQAKGGAWDNGVQAFAKGGMFTNSIVNTPTLFKFAQGTGLMGEAGPEAIMPLKRDSNGNLGVRANQQGNVEVVVNNFSNAQAQTKETQDSRGNRRIEVVIGEAAAGEMARPGSSAQGAMRSTYGMSPQLIRR